MYKDEYGAFVLEAEIEEGGKFFQWRKYVNSPQIKGLGGMYAIWCENDHIKFYRSSYLRDKAYPKFVKENI